MVVATEAAHGHQSDKTHGTDSTEDGSEPCDPCLLRDSRSHPRCPMLPSALGSWGQGDIVNMQAFIVLKAMFDQLGAIGLVAACARVLPHPIATNSRGSAGVNVSSSLRLNFVPPSHAVPAWRELFFNAL